MFPIISTIPVSSRAFPKTGCAGERSTAGITGNSAASSSKTL